MQGNTKRFNDILFYQDNFSFSYQEFLISLNYIEHNIFCGKKLKRVALVLPDGITFACLILYCLQKYDVLPLTSRYVVSEYKEILSSFNVDCVVTFSGLCPALEVACSEHGLPVTIIERIERMVNACADTKIERKMIDPCFLALQQGRLLLFTSGTTGKPKKVILTWRNLNAAIQNMVYAYKLAEGDVCLNVMPLYHIHGLVACLLSSVYTGASVILLEEGFNVIKFFQSLERFKPTWYSAVPSIHQSILNWARMKYKSDVDHCLRFIRSSSSGLPSAVAQGLSDFFKVPVLQAYGLTETTNMAVAQTLFKKTTLGSVGYPLPNTEVVIRDERGVSLPCETQGEICLKGPGIFSGYEDLSLEQSGFFTDGFFRTGDEGMLSGTGELTIVSRIKELINKGGEKIAPQEIEAVALTHPGVDQAVCFSVEDEYYGEDIGLAIVLKSGESVSENAIKEYISHYVSDKKVPKNLYFLQELPKGRTGKLKRIGLEKLINPISQKVQINLKSIPDSQRHVVTALLDIWKEELQLSDIGIEDSFIQLGGDSFLAIRIVNEINKRLHISVSMASIFKYPNIAALAQHLSENQGQNIVISRTQLPVDHYLLSFVQEGLWFIEQYAHGTHAYNISMLFNLSAAIQLEVLFASLEDIINRHEVLRSLIKTNQEGIPYQVVLDAKQSLVQIKHHIVSDMAELNLKMQAEMAHIFDLATECPIRMSYYELEVEGNHVQSRYLSIVVHHIVFDGFWSKNLFLREWDALYNHHVQKAVGIANVPNLNIQFKDFAMWQRHFLDEQQIEKRLSYWEGKLAGYEPLNLTTDFVRPARIEYAGADLPFKLDATLSGNLRAVAKKLQVSLFSVLLTGYYLLLRCYSNHDDVVVGTVFANRQYPQVEYLIGYFVNSLPLRSQINPAQQLADYIKSVSQEVVDAQVYQDLPFDKLVEKLEVKDASRHPIFQVLFEVRRLGQEYKLPLFKLLDYYELESNNKTAKFDLTMTIDDSKEVLSGVINYRTSLFMANTIAHYIETYQTILNQIGKLAIEKSAGFESNLSIKDLHYLSPAEYQKMLIDWNATDKIYPQQMTIHAMFEGQVLKTPNNIAVVFEDKQLTYAQLNEKANQLAHYLQTRYQVKENHLIALYLDRSEYLLVAILGILKAGAAYVPLDPTYPEERINYILTDIKTYVVLSQERYSCKIQENLAKTTLSSVTVEIIDSERFGVQLRQYPKGNPCGVVSSQSLAYVIYTSGTTGKPKGVMLQHQGIINRIKWMNDTYQLVEQDAVMQKTPYVFDVSVWELFWAIWYGARIVFAKPAGHKDAHYLLELILRRNITIMHFVPSLLNVFLQTIGSSSQEAHKQLPSLRYIFCSGEALSLADVKEVHRLLPSVQVHNLYGPTEASVDVLYYACTAKDIAKVYIGRPIDNTTAYVLNKEKCPVPIGAIGELYIGGEGLARGYLNRPELTVERFIDNPFQTSTEKRLNKNSRLYKTGDLVRYHWDGNIDYIGRTDFQVKIRGFRVELEEIEKVLSTFPSITHSVVVVKSQNNTINKTNYQYLIGYYLAEHILNEAEILTYLHKKLPDYMVPVALVWLEKLPLNINGKLDQKLLPLPELTKPDLYVAPVTDIEKDLCDIYSQVLGIPFSTISVTADFFSLGGHSLLMIQLVHRLNQKFNIELAVADVFEKTTVRALSVSIEVLKNRVSPVAKEVWKF